MHTLRKGNMLRLCKDCMHLMSRADVERRGERCRILGMQTMRMAVEHGGKRLRSMLPWYSPRRFRLPASMAVLSEHYNRRPRAFSREAAYSCPP